MNEENIIALVDIYGDALYKFCFKLAGNKEDADDLFQNTFVKLVEQNIAVDPDNNPKALLISIAVRLWQSECRKSARRLRLVPRADFDEAQLQADSFDLEKEVISREDCAQVRRIVAGLDEMFRLPLYMYYSARMSTEEIGSTLGIPKGTVKSRLHKARQILRESWEAAGYAQ